MDNSADNQRDNKKKPPFFTEKRKLAAAVLSAAAVLLWLILWQIFPMEFYSLFFASYAGSNFTLLLLSLVITFPANYIASKALKTDVKTGVHAAANMIGMVGCIYLYSAFRYNAPYFPILGFAAHICACAVIFVKSKGEKIPKIKDASPGRAKLAISGAVCTVCSDLLYLLLFTALLNIFRE
ncbi:MAG: hypothetical protein NC120_03590 [Ruminococcus sp.]|nr:hypothetical protein [Ruminococcus sp.]